MNFPQSALQLRNSGFNWPVSSRELGLVGSESAVSPFRFARDEQPQRKTVGGHPAAVAAGNFRSIADKRRKPLWTLLSCLTLSWRRDTSGPLANSKTSNKRATWRATAVPRWEKFRSVHCLRCALQGRRGNSAKSGRLCRSRARLAHSAVCACVYVRMQGEAARHAHGGVIITQWRQILILTRTRDKASDTGVL